MKIKAFAKINLSLDVGRVQPDGMHPVDMLMQGIDLCDNVSVELRDGYGIKITTSTPELSCGEDNIAYKAASEMLRRYGACPCAKKGIDIDIEKRIPMAAGLAGGSADAAAVIILLSILWDLNVDAEELFDVGACVGSDVPFCIAVQLAANDNIPVRLKESDLACTCARARGTGTELVSVQPLAADILLVKPPIGVSTREVYQAMDLLEIAERPNNDELQRALNEGRREAAFAQMINVMENYTLVAKQEAGAAKEELSELLPDSPRILMTGSGPTIFAILQNAEEGMRVCEMMRTRGYEAFCCRSI